MRRLSESSGGVGGRQMRQKNLYNMKYSFFHRIGLLIATKGEISLNGTNVFKR